MEKKIDSDIKTTPIRVYWKGYFSVLRNPMNELTSVITEVELV